MPYRFQWCSSLQAAAFPAAAYQALCARLPQCTPFNHLGWLQAAEQALEAGEQLHVLLAWEGEQLCLCLPLVSRRERIFGLRWTVLRHLGFPLSDRIALLGQLDPAGLAAALVQIRRQLPHSLLQLHEVRADPAWLQCWGRASSTCEQRLSCRVPVHAISAADAGEPSGDLRYKLRRARKRSSACGAQLCRVTPDAQNIAALLERIAAVEDASWKGEQAVGIFSGVRRRQWMLQAFASLAAAGLVRVVLLEQQGRCLSYRLGLLLDGRLYDYNLAFLPDCAELGSGRLLLDEWIRWGLEEGWQYVDASRVSLSGSSHQLHERCSSSVEQWRWSFYSWRSGGLLLGLAYRLWRLRRQAQSRHAIQL